jgi:hypothetical protein
MLHRSDIAGLGRKNLLQRRESVTVISDEMMRERLGKTKAYAAVILREGPNWRAADARAILWEHGRRNFALREERKLCIVCPVTGDGDVRGIGIFDAPPEEVEAIMTGDPAIEAGVLTFAIHACRGFPGDVLA